MTDLRLTFMVLLGVTCFGYSYARARETVDPHAVSPGAEQISGGAGGIGGGGNAGIGGGAGNSGTAGNGGSGGTAGNAGNGGSSGNAGHSGVGIF